MSGKGAGKSRWGDGGEKLREWREMQTHPASFFKDDCWFLPACHSSVFSNCPAAAPVCTKLNIGWVASGWFIFPPHKSFSLQQTIVLIVGIELKIRSRDEGSHQKLWVLKVNFNQKTLIECALKMMELFDFQLANNNEPLKVTMQNLKSTTGVFYLKVRCKLLWMFLLPLAGWCSVTRASRACWLCWTKESTLFQSLGASPHHSLDL